MSSGETLLYLIEVRMNRASLTGLSLNPTEVQQLLDSDSGDDQNFIAAQDRRCGAYKGINWALQAG